MYFWKVGELKEELKKGQISETDKFKYILAITILYSLAFIPLPTINQWDVYSAVLIGIISVLGIYHVFTCNNGSQGRNFLQNYTALGWVVGVRWFVMIVIPVLFVYFVFVEITVGIANETTSMDVLVNGAVTIVYFWILGKHVAQVANAPAAPAKKKTARPAKKKKKRR